MVELVRQLAPSPAEAASPMNEAAVRLRPYSSNAHDTWRRVDLDRRDRMSESHPSSPLIADVCLSDTTYAALFDWREGDLVLQLDSPRQHETAESAARRILGEIASGRAVLERARP